MSMVVLRFVRTPTAWGTPAFREEAKAEIEALDSSLLPLQAGLARSSHVAPGKVGAVILGGEVEAGRLRLKAGLFYAGIIAGCSCADDPTPVDEITEYCEVEFDIEMSTGAASVILIT
jgi:hypothetical protein